METVASTLWSEAVIIKPEVGQGFGCGAGRPGQQRLSLSRLAL